MRLILPTTVIFFIKFAAMLSAQQNPHGLGFLSGGTASNGLDNTIDSTVVVGNSKDMV